MNKLVIIVFCFLWILISDLACIMNKIVISERFLSYLTAMVGKGSPKLRMIASGSPKLRRFLPTASATNKKSSPKCSGVKKSGGSPKGMVFNVPKSYQMFSCKSSIIDALKFLFL